MIVIRKCNILCRNTGACVRRHSNNSMIFCAHNSSKNYVKYCITSVCSSRSNINNARNLSSAQSANSLKDLQSTVTILSNSINNDVVNMNMIESITEDLENNSHQIPQILSLLLLQCCGKLLYNEPLVKRQRLLDRVWSVLRSRGCTFTLDHYHSLLQAHIDNENVIDPTEFLKHMTVVPEYHTYCLLLKVPSVDNCKFANFVMSNMECNTLPIEKNICNELMHTYAMNGNASGILKVVKLMERENITPLDSYNIYLMYVYAKSGKIEKLTESLKGTTYPLWHIAKLVKCLSSSGNGAYIPNVLEYIEPQTTKKDFISLVTQLVHAGNVLDACNIVTHIPDNCSSKDIKEFLVHFLLDEVIKLNEDPKAILKVVNYLAEKDSIINVWKQAIESSLRNSKDALAFVILNEMKAKGISIKSDYFWPLFSHTQKQNTTIDIYSVLQHMVVLDVIVDFTTLVKYVFPFIDVSNNPVATVIKIKECGVAPSNTVEPLVNFLLHMGKLKEGIMLCTSFRKKIDAQNILDSLFMGYMKTNDISSCIHLLYEYSYNGAGFCGVFMQKLLNIPHFSESHKEDLIKFLIASKHHQVSISPYDAQQIQEKILHMNFERYSEKLILQLLPSISSGSAKQNYNTGSFLHPEYMNVHQLQDHLHELRRKNKNHRGILRKLLIKYCNMNDANSVHELVSEIKRNNFEWTPAMKLSLFDFYIKTKMLEEAVSILREIQSQFPDFKIDNYKILRFAKFLVENNKLNDAFVTLQKCTSINHKPDAHVQVHDLLNSLIKNNYTASIEKMINLLAEQRYTSDNYQLFRYLILTQMMKGDIQSAVHIFTRCVQLHKKTPAKQEILLELMKLSSTSTEYNELLEKVHELITYVHGESVADVNLVVALALCNRISELRIFLQKTSIREQLLLQQLHFLKDKDVIDTTLAMLEVSDDVMKIYLTPICNLALSIYDKQGDCEGAVQLKKKMDLNGVKCNATFQKTYSTLLKVHKFSKNSSNIELEQYVNHSS